MATSEINSFCYKSRRSFSMTKTIRLSLRLPTFNGNSCNQNIELPTVTEDVSSTTTRPCLMPTGSRRQSLPGAYLPPVLGVQNCDISYHPSALNRVNMSRNPSSTPNEVEHVKFPKASLPPVDAFVTLRRPRKFSDASNIVSPAITDKKRHSLFSFTPIQGRLFF